MERKINNIENANKHVNKSELRTIITFRTQQLYDLWVNEMQGQISDGMWENSRHTDWLWKNTYVRLGDETKVEVSSKWIIGKKSFGMSKDLWAIIGDRIIAENGFANEKEAKKAWREIAVAIYNASVSKEVEELRKKAEQEKRKNASSQKGALIQEWEEIVGDHKDSMDSPYYPYCSYDFNKHDVHYTDGSVRKQCSYLFLHIQEDKDGNLEHEVQYHNTKWYVPVGKLAEAVEAIKEFDNKMRF